jgi:hypothetical protein
MPATADEWLPILLKRLDDRAPRVRQLRSYVNGDAPLPEMGENTREAWKKFQKKARTNWGELVVEALAERCVYSGVTVGDELSEDQTAREIVRRNRLVIQIGDLAREMFTTSVGYMIVGRDSFGRAVITAESPDYVYAAVDPLMPWKARAAVKVWRDVDEGHDYAYVWVKGYRAKYSRPIFDEENKPILLANSGDWAPDSQETYTGELPVYVFENHGGTGEFETHTDVLDRINLGLLQRIVTVAMQAFKQRALKGGLPQGDEGDDPDWAKIFEPAPGALWDLPEGIDLWESQDSAQGILAMLAASKDDIRDFAAATRTPINTLLPDGANQSAEGAAFAREGLVFKAKDRIERLKVGLNEVIAAALRIEDSSFDQTVEVSFAPAENVSMTEKSAAAAQAVTGGVPWRTRMTDIYGYSADAVDRMELELASEALIGGLNGSANGAASSGGAAVVRPVDGGGSNPNTDVAQAGVA